MLKEKYALTDEGVHNVKLGAIWTAISNLVIFMGIGILYMLMDGLVASFVHGAPLMNLLEPFPMLADSGVPLSPLVSLIIFFVLLFVTEYYTYYYQYGVIYKESGRQRIGLGERLRKLPLSFFGKRDLADLTETMMGDVKTTEHAYSHVLPELYGAYATLGIATIGLFVFDWRLALAALWSVPVAFVLLFATRKVLTPIMRETRVKNLVVSNDIQEALECVREVRATNQIERYMADIERDVDASEAQAIKAELISGICVSSAQIVLRLGLATTIVAGAAFILEGTCSFMVLFCFLLVVSRIYAPFDQALLMITELFAAQTSASRMRSFYEQPLASGSEDFAPTDHTVEFQDVSFSYSEDDDVPVLSGVSFTAQEGEVTALVGPSGSGKSTCTKLAARFWDANAGRIMVGGVDVSAVDPEVLLRDYAVVFQDVLLFDDTVMENIRLGRREASDEEVLAAARAANCDEFALRMSQGYDTPIGENGVKLSGGERQRISIARALLKNAPIVLLDEATASLDVENETQVQEALSRLLAGKTVIVIAHRMRTVMNADKIVVLKEGKVEEQGSPDMLMQNEQGLFHRMVTLQRESAQWVV